ncbi:hypothetical protein P4V86_22070 [Brevibacillus laterosporus]|uniref:hypothetical protein n=1 Tax=Brevibacillus laterosporus TaxID=1465 RepID=UPI0003787A81|nr:hypothetical protein [Brevibacillus laterosporus]ATO48272.1 hypothetical protein BrL25_03615 [Brevibacillus laterosporus DSM 25]MBG9804336.1 hypothetical protein [Brevibacillus laterosporus]MED2006019.1 hypothetical protein [Brevibacillus laterosporus]MED4764572.1 hypothetical protein [Brevibacillus laterosporus]TPH12670.1 hypothetical protein EGH09_16135 [Brevibacillus laterosporus]
MILHPRLLGAVREQLANKRKPSAHQQLSTEKRSTEQQSTEQKAYQTRKQVKTYEGRSPPISTKSNELKPCEEVQ